jgi:uncharacterized membrane protein
MIKKIILLFTLVAFLLPAFTFAQNEFVKSDEETFNAKVLDVKNTRTELIEWNNTEVKVKEIEIKILDGSKEGQVVEIETDFPGVEKGKKINISYFKDVEGAEIYTVLNLNRFDAIIGLVLFFIIAVILLSGWQGVRAVISLFVSFYVLIAFLVPGILGGWNPMWASIILATGILFVAIFFTHGCNKESTVAFSGTFISIIITSFLAIFATSITSLTGYTDDISTYLNFNTQGQLDFTALLLGAMIIGIIGVLDDIAVTQAAVVTELYNSNKNIKKSEVFKRAMRVGREHVSALVNTIVFAYIGAAFPLILLFNVYQYNFQQVVSLEIIATEIVRAVVGSIGLILTVPIVTLLAVVFLKNYKGTGKEHHHHHHH